jgi:2-oxoglutarate ferredoxin oxidoreductase subunit beta
MKTKSTPFGNPEMPLNPIALALSAGCSFVARGFSGNPKQLVEIYKAAVKHKGFAYIDTFSPCVTFNKVNIGPKLFELIIAFSIAYNSKY